MTRVRRFYYTWIRMAALGSCLQKRGPEPEMSLIWIYTIFLFIGTFLLLAMGVTALVRRRTVMSVYFALFCLATAIYAFGYGMELTRTTEYGLKLWSRFQYLGMPFIVSFLLTFIVHFVSQGRRVNPIVNFAPILASIIILTVRQTNQRHYLYYRGFYFNELGDALIMTFDKGPWYWIFAAYNVLCLTGSTVLIILYMFRAPKAYGRQATWLLMGTVIPLSPYLIYVTGLVPGGIDIIPASIVVASFTYYVAIFRHDLFSLVPIGRDRLVETMSEAVLVLNTIEQVADVNPSARKAFCDNIADPIGRHIDEVFPMLSTLDSEPRLVKYEGKAWEMTRVPVDDGRRTAGYLVLGHDVTERVNLVDRLERAAREDALTGLLNRHSWDRAVSTELLRLSRHGRFGSIIYLDLDGFKAVNDSHGHAAGDSILRAVGRVLKEGVRRPDLVGRYGGEEFVLFLPEIHPEAAVDVAERLRVDLYEGIRADKNVEVEVTGSFGVAGGIITDDVTLEELVTKADNAMYESKRTGKNRVSWNRN